MNKVAIHICAAGLLLIAWGCGSKVVSIDSWQDNLQNYAAIENNGDLSVLRESSGNSAHMNFTVIGANSPEKSTDVTGILLGRRTIQSKAWLVFLVGANKNRIVQDIRLALLDDSSNTWQWIVGSPDPAALDAYRKHKTDIWRGVHPNRAESPLYTMTFPGEEDAYTLETVGNTVTAVETKSGTQWKISIDQSREQSTSQQIQRANAKTTHR